LINYLHLEEKLHRRGRITPEMLSHGEFLLIVMWRQINFDSDKQSARGPLFGHLWLRLCKILGAG